MKKSYHPHTPRAGSLGLPQPLTRRRVCPLPFGSGGRGTLAGGRGVWESPNSDEGTYTVVLFIYIYSGRGKFMPLSPKSKVLETNISWVTKILSKALKINLYSSYADLSHGERSALKKHYVVCQRSLKYTHFRCMFFWRRKKISSQWEND